MDIIEIKSKIKEWEYAFRKQHNKLPSKSDIKDDVEIHKLYSLYKSIKSGQSQKPSKQETTEEPASTQSSPVKKNEYSPRGELGPTPQANGRVLSIFDLKMTPPESSPLKHKSDKTSPLSFTMPPPQSPVKNIIETPTKSKNKSFTTPIKGRKIVFETPSYLNKHRQNPQTPDSHKNNAVINFSVSPSPFKTQRGIGKRLTEVYNTSLKEAEDLKSFNLEEEFQNEEKEESEAIETMNNNDEKIAPRNKRTQKRSTRRVKMAPRPVDSRPSLDNVNLQDHMTKLEEGERKQLAAYMDSDEEDDSKDRENDIASVFESPTKKTRMPVSNNFKRLKINDPRSRRFKQRMRR
ncbi:DNA replication and checkpoint protein, putative [Candida dubliniensis CD36]|uniref:DNA replication regulator SLD2 n=1 Tax=Candida dubliniensis (strain CD36 / ATCC MYA-646 / CBS 7987 / NCPF 3949 / NRRL Y-17841) TaxID=573826 RepID=B9WLD5_CANDC|nr:DNA replication and checkpoint protein, putative [Candida dubliniensis CD36]CAX39865.1 DNA replication and checkpoint protein, putative [Candida dubliniensis CD36]